MPTRGQQFPLHNTGYFHAELPEDRDVKIHQSSHHIEWGAGAGAFKEKLDIHHEYDAHTGAGHVTIHGQPIGPHGSRMTVAALQYKLTHAERATSLKVQPVIRTDMIEVHEDYQGSGLATKLMNHVSSAHPGVSHPASDELSEWGAPWRAHRVQRGLDTGERLAHGPWESTDTHGPRIFRPVEPEHAGIHEPTGKPYDTRAYLMEPGHFDPHDRAGEQMEHDKWVAKASKIKKVPRDEDIWG